MKIWYLFKEGFTGFRRARLSMVISISTLTISLLLLGFFGIVYRNANGIIQSFRDKVEMEVFLEEPVSDSTIVSMRKTFEAVPGISHSQFISKEEAAKIFKKEFGEDIFSVLEFNPLPPSFKLQLMKEYKNTDSANIVYAKLKNIQGIDDVVYRKALLEILDRRVKIFIGVSIAAGIILLIAAIFLVSNTIRLTIFAKRKIITTMKLVGATRSFIRAPFLIEGILQGLIGGIIASLCIYGIAYAAKFFVGVDLANFLQIQYHYLGILLLLGMFLGYLGSILSVRRFISEDIIVQ
ncbi:MAG: ABC transporter permease [Bacteroidetes bacterium]|nr:ABC transporter permease [Bacteroidota bacterium]